MRKLGILGQGGGGFYLHQRKGTKPRQAGGERHSRWGGGYWVALAPSPRGICSKVGDCSMMRTSSRSM